MQWFCPLILCSWAYTLSMCFWRKVDEKGMKNASSVLMPGHLPINHPLTLHNHNSLFSFKSLWPYQNIVLFHLTPPFFARTFLSLTFCSPSSSPSISFIIFYSLGYTLFHHCLFLSQALFLGIFISVIFLMLSAEAVLPSFCVFSTFSYSILHVFSFFC